MQYFASFEPFEIFDNFNGVQGTYIKSFLISDAVNLNKWQATHEANISNLDTFLGRPGIHYINPENAKRNHTGATSFEKSLQLQELYRAASIIAVGSDIPTKKNWQVSKMIKEDIAEKIRTEEIKWISPSIWPDEDAVEIIDHTDGTQVDRVHGYRGLHYAFVDEPAYDVDAEIKSFCDGTTKACQIELQKFDASINEVNPITDKKIIIPDKNKTNSKKKNSSKKKANTSDNSKKYSKIQMATEEELQKELDESEKALKATEEELEKLKDKEAKKAQEQEEEEKESKGRKAEEEKKDDEEKTALKAAVERLEKEPIVEKIVAGQLSAGIITEDKISEITSGLMAATKDELNRTLNTSKSYEAKLKSLSTNVNVPYMGSDGGSFDASLNDIDDEQLLMEVSG